MKKGKPRLMPITLWNFTKTVISFSIFFIGSIILTITGFVLLTLCGKTKKHKYKYHQILCVTFKILAKMMIQVPFTVINKHNERFEKPGIIISNHQSHLDLLYTLMLSPKIIVLTNKWVWKAPFYGWIIRYADFLPVIDGIEHHVDRLEKLVKDGYSILVFPEGTRSEDCRIGRFRKGAFYLADKLNVDIIPLVIHGIGHVLPKTEFMLRKGQIHIEIGERISPDHAIRKDKDMLEVSKNMRQLHKKRYENLAVQVETVDYFSDKVYHNYIYKGAIIERRARKNLKKHDNYRSFIAQLPESGNVLILNCGQGELPLMCALVKKNLTITATETDKDLFTIAKNCISIPENLTYLEDAGDCGEGDVVIDCAEM
jgi:1-acyl-sn-glycerol-3-phosphate acyltransferase